MYSFKESYSKVTRKWIPFETLSPLLCFIDLLLFCILYLFVYLLPPGKKIREGIILSCVL